MAVLHRALFTWFMLLLFVVLLVLRLDEKAIWNWFIIFIPIWIFDGIILVYIMFRIITHCRGGYDRHDLYMTIKRKVVYFVGVVLKLTFQILICIKLQYEHELSLYMVMIPAWILLLGMTIDIGLSLKV